MARSNEEDDEDDGFFQEVYGKEYVAPTEIQIPFERNSEKNQIFSNSDFDPEHASRDGNEIPTDFTSREAKFWEAKNKSIERNWKRKKEEELICRKCGEYGHFAQGCPSTLGKPPKKTNEVTRLLSFKEKRLIPRLIGTGGVVIQGLEKDTSCRIKLEDGPSGGDGSFTINIIGSSHGMVNRAETKIRSLVSQIEEEWSQQGTRKGYREGAPPPNLSHGFGPSHSATGRLRPAMPGGSRPSAAPYPVPAAEDYVSRSEFAHRDKRRVFEPMAESVGYGEGSRFDFDRMPEPVARVRSKPAMMPPFLNSEEGLKRQNFPVGILLSFEEWGACKNLHELENKFGDELRRLDQFEAVEEEEEKKRHMQAMREIKERFSEHGHHLKTIQFQRRTEFIQTHPHSYDNQTYENKNLKTGPSYKFEYKSSLSASEGIGKQPEFNLSLNSRGDDVGYNEALDSSFNGRFSSFSDYPTGQYR